MESHRKMGNVPHSGIEFFYTFIGIGVLALTATKIQVPSEMALRNMFVIPKVIRFSLTDQIGEKLCR